MIVLYHFTLARYVDAIREHGLLSMASKAEAGMYPPGHRLPPEQFAGEDNLVWLTRKPDGDAGLQGAPEPKIRVTVEAEDAVRWDRAADRYGVPPWWRETMRIAAEELSPGNSDRDWYVVEGRIPPEQITVIEEWS